MSDEVENCFYLPFIYACFPVQCMLTRFLHCRSCVGEVIAPSLVAWPVLVSKTDRVETEGGGSAEDDVKKSAFVLVVQACITLFYFKLKWWYKSGDMNL